jgi:AraC-like DNA-binding protein
MAEESSVPLTAVVNTTPLRQTVGSTLHWDSLSGVCHDLGSNTVSDHEQRSSFQAKGSLVSECRGQRYWKTSEIRPVPALSLQAIAWEHEAELATFSLDAVHLSYPIHEGILGATGELVWISWQEQSASSTPSVYPTLLIHTPHASLLGEHVEIVPSLQAHDPLLNHIVLVLRAVIENKDLAGQLYAESLVDALVVHFLRRYGASRHSLQEVAGGLSPYKLQRTTAYIKDHLAQELSLITLATVGETSPAHFARLFKHTTGLAPHQYVIRCRMDQAKQLLVETDVSLSEIGFQVGCADQSHFTALFRKHVAMTPKAYRDNSRVYSSLGHRHEPDSADT